MNQPSASSINVMEVQALLEASGWDVLTSEASGEVAARKEQPPTAGVWSLLVDQSGRFLFTATREGHPPDGWRIEQHGRPYQLLRETQHILNISGKLSDAGALSEVLQDLHELAQADGQTESVQAMPK
jgi:hypothetical protein